MLLGWRVWWNLQLKSVPIVRTQCTEYLALTLTLHSREKYKVRACFAPIPLLFRNFHFIKRDFLILVEASISQTFNLEFHPHYQNRLAYHLIKYTFNYL